MGLKEVSMKLLSLFGLIAFLHFGSAHAFNGYDQFKVEQVKPWGEFGFRALGKGKNLTEMRFDCSKAEEMGLIVTTVNSYGKTSHVVFPAGKLSSDKKKCQENLKQYFAGVYNKRTLASFKQKSRKVELNMIRGSLFDDVPAARTLSFL